MFKALCVSVPRIDSNAGDGVKVLVPIRPIAVLTGSIDLPAGDNVLSLM